MLNRPDARGDAGFQVESDHEEDASRSDTLKKNTKIEEYLTPTAVKDHIEKVWSTNTEILQRLFGVTVDDPMVCGAFFIEVLSVPPPRFRPVSTCTSDSVSVRINISK